MSKNYANLKEPPTEDENSFASGKIMMKLCSFGVVSSKKWIQGYMTILDGVVRIYDSKETAVSSPQNHVFQITLDRRHRASDIKKKDYSQDKSKVIDFYCFYIEVDNGIFAASKKVKIGCLNFNQAASLAETININCKPDVF